ncbi:hypothetical protein HDU79_007445 [Rhizoclosmatium sp. JEL0117]|nr:hypothetical protein HDU79_007445 [Rhizoclosmatium sp. JEL0117]
MGATVSKQKQKKTPIHTNSSSLVPSAEDNSIAALTQPERTIVSQVLDQQKKNIHTTPVSAEMMSVNVVEKAVETVADTEKERANMLDPNHFSIKGVSVKYFSSLVDVWGGCSELKGMTTQDICNKFIKPQTESSKLSWCADMYLSNDPNLMGQVHDANYFISHAWKYTFLDVVEALTNFVDSNKLDPEATIIWFDLLSNSQHNTSAKDFTWWTTVFQNAIQKIGSVVLIMQPWDDPIPLTRAWCVIKTGLDANQFSIVHVKWFSGNPKPKVTIELKDTDKYAPKPDVLEAVNKHMRAVDLLKTSVLCQIPSNIILSSRHVRRRPCTMGIFLCSIIRDAVNAECCIINAGTFRGNKKYVDVKDFTYMDLEAEMPYASEIAQYMLPGRVIQEVIAFTRAPALQNPPVEKGGFMQSCDRIKWDPATNTVVSIGGEPLDMDRMYSTAISYQAVAGLDNITPLLKYFNVDPAAPQANGHQDFDYIGAKELIVSHFCLSLWHDMLLSESFESMDKDNLGYITKDEVFEAVKKHYQGDHALSTVVVDNLFSMADVSGDGKISRKEFFGLKLFVMEEIDFNGRDQDDVAEVVLTPEIIAVEAEYEKEVAREIVSSVEGTREIKLDATVDANGNQRLSVEELKKFVKEEVKKVGHAVSLLGGAAEE